MSFVVHVMECKPVLILMQALRRAVTRHVSPSVQNCSVVRAAPCMSTRVFGPANGVR